MSGTVRWVVLAAAVAAGTWYAGWWTLPVLGFLFGVAAGGGTPGRAAALAAAAAWAALLAGQVVMGYPVGRLATRLAGAMQLPAVVLVLLTLLLPALLTGPAATLGARARGRSASPAA